MGGVVSWSHVGDGISCLASAGICVSVGAGGLGLYVGVAWMVVVVWAGRLLEMPHQSTMGRRRACLQSLVVYGSVGVFVPGMACLCRVGNLGCR